MPFFIGGVFRPSLDVTLSCSLWTHFSRDLAQYCPCSSPRPFIMRTPKFAVNDILPPFNGTIQDNNGQTSLIFSHTRQWTEDFPRSKNHLGDPCANGRGSGVEDRIEDLSWVGGGWWPDNDIPETQRWTFWAMLSCSGWTGMVSVHGGKSGETFVWDLLPGLPMTHQLPKTSTSRASVKKCFVLRMSWCG